MKIQSKPITASHIEWAYLAGVIDGEGCVRATESKPYTKLRKYVFAPRFRVEVKITNTSEHLIGWIHERFGGYVHLNHTPGKWKATKNCWIVIWTGGAAEQILRGSLPYLIVKKHQAELAFQLREMVHARSPEVTKLPRNKSRLPESEIMARGAIVQALKDAKKTQ